MARSLPKDEKWDKDKILAAAKAMEKADDVVERSWLTSAGLPALCIMVRESHRCGYVGVPIEHGLWGLDYDEIHEDMDIDVHGGLTWSGEMAGGRNPGIPEDWSGEYWWVGFDCAHAGDKTALWDSGVERTTEYVVDECESLARQLQGLDDNEDDNEEDEPNLSQVFRFNWRHIGG